MSAAYIYSLLTFATGIILLMGWLYVAASNARLGKLLVKSVLFFAVPIGAAVAVPDRMLNFPLALWVVVLVEEALKASAAATEREPLNRFWLVTLFGIWELALAKSMWGIEQVATFEALTAVQAVGVVAMGVITVLMHSVTAELYAFRFGGRLPVALAVSWVLHVGFNEAVTFLGMSLGLSLVFGLLLLLPLALLFWALWPTRSKSASTP